MERDLLHKRYLCDNDRFADLLNGIVGEQLVEPESLTELDTQTGVFSTLRNRFGRNKRQGYRDLLKKAAFGINFLVVGIENQESVHYLMPLRCMSYDAGEYERQAAHIFIKNLACEILAPSAVAIATSSERAQCASRGVFLLYS